MGPVWCGGSSMLDTAGGPLPRQDVNLGRGERSIAWRRLHHLRDGQTVPSVFQERLRGDPSSRETRQVRGSLVGERTVAMASDDARIPEQLFEHDEILPSVGIPSHSNSNDVVKSGMNLSICLGFAAPWPHL
jgi:hypothetical protein